MDKNTQIPYNLTMYDLPAIETNGQTFARCVAQAKPYAPVHVKIKITWRCNLRCEMCNVWRQKRQNALTPERLRSLADELVDLGCRKIHLSGGEVLLRPDLYDLISYLSNKGVRVNLTTNGTLLTRDVALRLADSGLRGASISIDSPQRRIHDRIRGQGTWKRALKGLRELRRAQEKRRAKLRIRVNTIVSRTNYESLADLATFIHQRGADRLTLIPVDDANGDLWLNKTRLRHYNSRIAPRIADEAWIETVHSRDLVVRARSACEQELPFLDVMDVGVCRESFDVKTSAGRYSDALYPGHEGVDRSLRK